MKKQFVVLSLFDILSARPYQHIRGETLLKLPSRNTLRNYIGIPSGETGFNKLIEIRHKAEAENMKAPQSRVCSLIVDKMAIKGKLQYHKQQDCFVGHAGIGL